MVRRVVRIVTLLLRVVELHGEARIMQVDQVLLSEHMSNSVSCSFAPRSVQFLLPGSIDEKCVERAL